MKKWLYIGALILVVAPYFSKSQETLNICTWYDLIPESVIKKFEEESGIKVVQDFFDGNDILETKLLTDNPGYDVVTPTAMPYLSRGIALGLYTKLDFRQLPNIVNVSPIIDEKNKNQKEYGVAYGFGTFGLFYNKKIVHKFFPVVDSYELLFNLENVKKLAPYGIALNDDVMDVLSSVMTLYGFNTNEEAYKVLARIRPYIKYFNISRHANDMNLQEIVISLTPNHEAMKAVKQSKEGKFGFVIPKSEKTLYCDALSIPKGAPHLKNAYTFINFLLRPDIAAMITNETLFPNSVSFVNPDLVNEEIKNSPQLFLTNIEEYHLHKSKNLTEYRQMSEQWIRIIMGKK